MAELKTVPNDHDVAEFIAQLADEQRQAECQVLLPLMAEASGESPRMWGDAIVGYGSYHYVYPSGREGDWLMVGFSPRKRDLTIYLLSGFEPLAPWMDGLGRYKTSKSCLYLRRLEDIHLPTLTEMVRQAVAYLRRTYPAR